MLSRTAENLFWIARYMERAETMARLLEVGYRIALMPSAGDGHLSEWTSILESSGAADEFHEKYGEPTQSDVEDFLFFDRDNPSSVASCLNMARNSARTVRTAVTTEVWDALNGSYQELKSLEVHRRRAVDLPMLCDWTKRQAALTRGAIVSTQLRGDGYDFLNLGYFLERAGNTARMLDVKYHVLLPTTDRVGGAVDNYQWTTLLRSLSAYRSFHWAYGGDYNPTKIAHFLILNTKNPRSLLQCSDQATYHLNRLARAYGQTTKAQNQARSQLAVLAEAEVTGIIQDGLHEFLTAFIARNAALSQCVADSYLFGPK